jgi:dihydroflavonol-4-reductase
MPTLITGATGFIGSRVARLLAERGEGVRAMVRAASRRENLAGLDLELVEGDLKDPGSLRRAVEGCETVYHVAADYRLWARDPGELERTNVGGTRNLLEACRAAGVRKVVYTSSVGALGIPRDGTPGTEATPVALTDMIGVYKRTKFLAEEEALRFAAEGLPVVLVHPSTPVGPGDIKPTPTGKIVVDFVNGRMPAFVDTGLNIVDVDDVAAGHLLAAERGRVGEKYILGNRNMTLREILEALADITGRPAPKVEIPYALAWSAGWVSTSWASVTGSEPGIPLEGVRMARKKMFFDASKAVRELGLPQTPVETALERAVRWFADHGYVRRGGLRPSALGGCPQSGHGRSGSGSPDLTPNT